MVFFCLVSFGLQTPSRYLSETFRKDAFQKPTESVVFSYLKVGVMLDTLPLLPSLTTSSHFKLIPVFRLYLQTV